MVLPAWMDRVPTWVRGGKSTAGFRIPAHAEVRELLQQVGPVVNPSANITGCKPAQSAEEIEQIFGKQFPIFATEQQPNGEASTVVQLEHDGTVQILRQGACQLT